MVEKILPSIADEVSKRLHSEFDEWQPDTEQDFWSMNAAGSEDGQIYATMHGKIGSDQYLVAREPAEL